MDSKANLSIVNWDLVRIEKRNPGTNKFRDPSDMLKNIIGFLRSDANLVGHNLWKLDYATGLIEATYNGLL
ncbi:uncharacterized protein KD926_006179 [Aspergillus affinis]|uniref:uncharacterized protein n=1 Tax=Aspergillus affinis TaxID=1070780 RepID=UPI0022FDDD52|nr:uncharacterized protein KD926_006179 [Aspergillus affinis]KAI9042055.1 hypothetical protein KD926_006179 [Aspergillus affinis]